MVIFYKKLSFYYQESDIFSYIRNSISGLKIFYVKNWFRMTNKKSIPPSTKSETSHLQRQRQTRF